MAKATSMNESMPSSQAIHDIHAEERRMDVDVDETIGVRCLALVTKGKPQPTEEQELLGCLPWQHLRQLDVDLEKLLGEVPAGWRLLCTTDVTEHLDVKQRVEGMIQGRPSNSEIIDAEWQAILINAIKKGMPISAWNVAANLQWAFVRLQGIKWLDSSKYKDLSDHVLGDVEEIDPTMRDRLEAALIVPHAGSLLVALFNYTKPTQNQY